MYSIYESLLSEKGLSSYKVAKDCGIAQSSLSDWKRGKSKPKHEKMLKIADYLGVDVDYLETGVMPESIKKEPAQPGKLSDKDIKFLEALHSVPEEKQELILKLLDSMKDK